MARLGLTSDRKFRRIARLLDDTYAGFGEVIARGALELLWDAAYEACDDFVGDETDVEAAAHWRGKTGVLCAALMNAGGDDKAGFIEEGGSAFWPEGKPGTYRIHDLWDHAPDFIEKRVKREIEREAKGTTIKELRAAAGRKGRAAQLGRSNGGQMSDTQPANGGQTAAVCPESPANGGQASGKSRHSPVPSRPAPGGPEETSLSPACASARGSEPKSPEPEDAVKEADPKANGSSGDGVASQPPDSGEGVRPPIAGTEAAAGRGALSAEQVERDTARRLGAEDGKRLRGGLPTRDEIRADQYPATAAVLERLAAVGIPMKFGGSHGIRTAHEAAIAKDPEAAFTKLRAAWTETPHEGLGWFGPLLAGIPAGSIRGDPKRSRGMAIPDTDWTSEAATKL